MRDGWLGRPYRVSAELEDGTGSNFKLESRDLLSKRSLEVAVGMVLFLFTTGVYLMVPGLPE